MQPSAVPAAALRWWPAALLALAIHATLHLPRLLFPGTTPQFQLIALGPALAGTLFLFWWVFFSRAGETEKWTAFAVFGVAAGVPFAFAHPSVLATGFGIAALGVPSLCTLWALAAAVFAGRPRARRIAVPLAIAASGGVMLCTRIDGVLGDIGAEIAWRWSPTAEERFRANLAARAKPAANPEPRAAVALQPGDWPHFRGADRNSVGTTERFQWTPRPAAVWRQRIGPGWSSFAHVDGRLYTQEQRGDDEAVVCYDAATGAERWAHADRVRFTEALAGPGPRATPSFADGTVFALGATGILNALDAATGAVKWRRSLPADTGAAIPQWGFASSPLIANGLVVVHAGAGPGKSVVAYRQATGEIAWTAGDGGHSYASVEPARLAGEDLLLMATNAGLEGISLAGKVRFAHAWDIGGNPRMVQPVAIGADLALLPTGYDRGTRALRISRQGDALAARIEWESRDLRPYFNDAVVHNGHLYGFDNQIFACLDLKTGQRRWKGGRYGTGQVLLEPKTGTLLVLTEKGELAFVAADPERHRELGRFQALEGKTWNHPILVRDRLFVRNGEEAACYDLAAPLPPAAPPR